MRIDRQQLEKAIERGTLTQRTWDENTPCMMSALAGRSIDECTAAGWPKWLAEVGVWLFDSQRENDIKSFALEFTEATEAAEAREADYDEVYKEFRLGSVLPIALEAVGEGDEEWRVKCRAVVQWSIDHGGIANPDADAAAAAATEAEADADADADTADAAYGSAAAYAADAAGGGVGGYTGGYTGYTAGYAAYAAGYAAYAAYGSIRTISAYDEDARDSAVKTMQECLIQLLRGEES